MSCVGLYGLLERLFLDRENVTMSCGKRVMGRFSKAVTALVLLLCVAATAQRANAQADPNQGPGGPILVITSSSTTFGKYYAEILRTEGLNEFSVSDIGPVTATTLAAYDVVILAGPMTLSARSGDDVHELGERAAAT